MVRVYIDSQDDCLRMRIWIKNVRKKVKGKRDTVLSS
jgi:hypothetical protein